MDDIEKKYYRGYVKVNLDNVIYNINSIKRIVGSKVNIIAVVKADAYGHGMVPISREIENEIDLFAVASIDEALSLRRNNISKPILILGFIPEDRIVQAIENNISMTIYRVQDAEKVSCISKEIKKKGLIHIKIDTGMSRLGFKIDDCLIHNIETINELENVTIEGIFTHFSCADEDDTSITDEQILLFNKVLFALEGKGIQIGIKHCSNSAGIIDYPKAHMNAVRAGIILYGGYPAMRYVKNDFILLKPVLEWKSHIIYLKEVDENTRVSYGGIYMTKKKSKIATIPIGYADGYPRVLSNRADILINGKRAPIIGRVCMDQLMVDVTELKSVKCGDIVTLIGIDGNECITSEELSQKSGMINYEIFCGISKRMPRVYYKNEDVIDKIDYF